jgi:GT2 family glycosyltransferase
MTPAILGGTSRPTFRIGVPTYRRAGDLANLLAALAPQLRERAHVRLVVVNDAGHDDVYDRLVEQYRDVFDYRVASENRGPGPARGAAFESATEDYLVGLDDDCVPGPLWLEWLEAMVRANPDVDLFAGTTEPIWTRPPGRFQRLLAVRKSYPAPVVNGFGLITAVGANMAVRRVAYERAGGYSREMRGAAEDCHLTQRLLKAGATYRVCPDWPAGHKAENSISGLRRRFFWYGTGGAQYTILERDWRMASDHSDTTIANSWERITAKTAVEWRRSADDGQPLIMRLAAAAAVFLIELEYERGWRTGIRRNTERYRRGIPEIPPFANRFVDFADRAQATHAFGEDTAG